MRRYPDFFDPSVPAAILRFLFVSRCYSERDVNALKFFHNFLIERYISCIHTYIYVKMCPAMPPTQINI